MKALTGSIAALLLVRAVLSEICCTLIVVALLAPNAMKAAFTDWLEFTRKSFMLGAAQFRLFLRSVPNRTREAWDVLRNAFTRKQWLWILFLSTVIVIIFIAG